MPSSPSNRPVSHGPLGGLPQTPGTLERELDRLAPALWTRLEAAGFDRTHLITLAATLKGDPTTRRNARNRVEGPVAAPRGDENPRLHPHGGHRSGKGWPTWGRQR